MSTEQVQRLLRAQLPDYAGLPLVALPTDRGTDNAVFRLGEDLAVRCPRRPYAEVQVDRDQEVLRTLAGRVPCAVPETVAVGVPGEGYPYRWCVVRWVPGETPDEVALVDPDGFTDGLAELVVALRAVDPTDGPKPSDANFWRGCHLSWRDPITLDAIDAVADLIDADAVRAAWSDALAVSRAVERRWLHGDLHAANMVVDDAGALTGVIDWAAAGVGDAACDLMPAWTVLAPAQRQRFRRAVGVDDDEWERGRGWVLSTAVVFLAGYRRSMPQWVAGGCRDVAAALSDR